MFRFIWDVNKKKRVKITRKIILWATGLNGNVIQENDTR